LGLDASSGWLTGYTEITIRSIPNKAKRLATIQRSIVNRRCQANALIDTGPQAMACQMRAALLND
jgi:hypothetical protein